MDMTGKLIIKAGLKDDIRRIPIHNEDITYDELILMMQRVFKGKLNTTDEITIKYKDEDGDLITLSDDSDLAFAIQSGGKILKITLFINNLSDGIDQGNSCSQKREIKRQLDCIQQCLDDVVSRLEGLNSDSFVGDSVRSTDKKKIDPRERESRSSSRCSGTGNVPVGSKEFDPLTGAQKTIPQSIQPVPGSPRSGTPASAVSSGVPNSFLSIQGSPKHLHNSMGSTAPAPQQECFSQSHQAAYTPAGITYSTAGGQPQQIPPGQPTYAGQMPQQQPPQQSQQPQPQQQPTVYQGYRYSGVSIQGQPQPQPQPQPQQQPLPPQQSQAPPQLSQAPPQPSQAPPQQSQVPSQAGASMYYPGGMPGGYPPQSQQQQPSQQPPPIDSQNRQPQQQPQAPYGTPGAGVPNQQYPNPSGPPMPPGPPGPPGVNNPGQNMYARGGLNNKQAYQLGYR